MRCWNCLYSVSSWALFLRPSKQYGSGSVCVRVHISVMDRAGWLRVSNSARLSSGDGSVTGFLDRVSGASFFVPFTHSVIKLYAISLTFRRRGFSISSSW